MKKRTEKVTKEKGDSGAEDDAAKSADDYQCSGNLEMDFPELCALAGINEIPLLKLRQLTAAFPSTDSGAMEDSQTQISPGSPVTTWCPKPCIQAEMENDDSQSAKKIIISGWQVDEVMAEVLSKILPSLSNLQSLKMWQARLTDRILISLKNTISMCSHLRTVILEGNPIPEQSYHILIGEDSMITHLSLRNNCIGEEGACLIGSALSTVHSANKNLLTLNMAFNSIGDGGAIHIAQGLRLNRSLLCLSLANNHITDTGAVCLAEVIGPFALTHEEIVERRRQLMKRDQLPSQVDIADSKCERTLSIPSSSSLEQSSKGTKSASKKKDVPKKEEKTAALQTAATAGKKEVTKKDTKVPRGQGGKSEGKDKRLPGSEQEEKNSFVQKTGEVVEALSPLLDPGIRHIDGKVIQPGNTALVSLNLSGNKLTELSLQRFLASAVGQGEGGLLRLSLNRNCFPPDCETFLKIQEIMSLKDPLNKTSSCQVDDEQRQAA
ncbi:leucine-rich repeat-containing protein 71 isoform X1 [Pygocentrus nattereri]|uniref:Uncharacterized protein n=2 Tax=Pygocentrus nattereri TaxID=42514 RepID=A0A3B4CID8_PYGNA|nr:leucine-rich repeat-containing protein 71 isoform X1 [Pygocentrus nattereri]